MGRRLQHVEPVATPYELLSRLKPVPAPVRMTASQNPAAPRLAKMGGSFCPPGKGFSDFAFSVSPTALPSLADPDRHRPAAGGTIIPFQQA
jgi:hypothetical protein